MFVFVCVCVCVYVYTWKHAYIYFFIFSCTTCSGIVACTWHHLVVKYVPEGLGIVWGLRRMFPWGSWDWLRRLAERLNYREHYIGFIPGCKIILKTNDVATFCILWTHRLMAIALRKWPRVHLLEYGECFSCMMPSLSIFNVEKKTLFFLQKNNSTWRFQRSTLRQFL